MALCTVTGAVYLPSGELARSTMIKFTRVDKSVNAEYLGAVVPADVYTKTDRLGQVDFEILTGRYTMHVAEYSGGAVVPDALTANIADILTIVTPGIPVPAWLTQALAARDEAVAAASAAQGSAASIQPYDSYAAVLAASKPLPVMRVSALISGRLVEWVRDVSGSCLGGGWNPSGNRTPQHFGPVSPNATAAFEAMRNDHNARGGVTRIPSGDYTVNSRIVFNRNGARVVGDGSSSTIIRGGATIAYATCFDFEMSGFTVVSASGDGIVIGEDAGPQTYAAWFKAFDLKTNFAGGRGISFGGVYMAEIFGLRAQNSGGIGIDMSSGPKTSLTISNCHAVDGAVDGWSVKGITYSSMRDCGADRNDGYGYRFENMSVCDIVIGAEDSGLSAMRFHYNAATTDIIRAFTGVKIQCFEKDNNATLSTVGSFAHFTASSGTAAAGTIEFDGCGHFNPPAGNSMQIDSGNYKIIMPRSRNSIKRAVGGGSFSVVSDGAGDAPKGTPTSVPAALTAIAQLRPKITNGVNAFGGRLTVYVTNNNLASAARSATYELLVTRATGTSGISTIASVGNVTGATADSASFTFSFDATDNTLRVTPIGSTAFGNWYFHITASGNIDVEPL